MGKGSRRRKTLISEEEHELRWAYLRGEIEMSEEEFNEWITEIRKRTGKP